MREISISTEVFAKIWSLRSTGEEDENQILSRVLGVKEMPENKELSSPARILWRQDVALALRELGGAAHLKDIYEKVRSSRIQAGRSVPENSDAIVRRELEYNSSDTKAYQGKRDWFRSVDGIGSGVWALREEAKI